MGRDKKWNIMIQVQELCTHIIYSRNQELKAKKVFPGLCEQRGLHSNVGHLPSGMYLFKGKAHLVLSPSSAFSFGYENHFTFFK